jgi:hypothetical protein
LDADTVDGQHLDEAFDSRFFSFSADNGAGGRGPLECTLGEITLTAASYPPVAGVFAAGQTLAISTNSALFSLLGTQYGGDGRTTFQLPDLRDLAPRGTAYAICTTGVFPSRD